LKRENFLLFCRLPTPPTAAITYIIHQPAIMLRLWFLVAVLMLSIGVEGGKNKAIGGGGGGRKQKQGGGGSGGRREDTAQRNTIQPPVEVIEYLKKSLTGNTLQTKALSIIGKKCIVRVAEGNNATLSHLTGDTAWWKDAAELWVAAIKALSDDDLQSKALRAAAAATATETSSRPKKVLCAVFLSANDEQQLSLLTQNMAQTKGFCEWAVISYTSTSKEKLELLRTSGAVLATSYLPSANAKNASTSSLVAAAPGFVPKPLLYPLLEPLLADYERVWLLDSDISFDGFDTQQLTKTLSCLSKSALITNPLILQPLIKESTLTYPLQNYNTWFLPSSDASALSFRPEVLAHAARSSSLIAPNAPPPTKSVFFSFTKSPVSVPVPVACKTRMIEQTLPLIDATFFAWFLSYIVKPLSPVTELLQTDWGFDSIWCLAARDYLNAAQAKPKIKGQQNQKTKKPNDRPVPCSIILAGTPISHKDTRSIVEARDANRHSFCLRGEAMRMIVSWRFKTWTSSILEYKALNGTSIEENDLFTLEAELTKSGQLPKSGSSSSIKNICL